MMRSRCSIIFCLTLILIVMAVVLGCSNETPATTTSALTASAAATSPVAATTSATESPTPQKGGTLRFMYHRLPTSSVGWPATILPQDSAFMCPAVETLIVQAHDYTFKPRLATSWEIAPDKTSITFHLRKGVKFHDGSDFNATVAKFNLDAVKEAKHAGTAYWTGIDILDDYTIRVNLSEWQNTALQRFTSRTGQMVSQAAVQKNGVEWAKTNPVGTGPFTFVSLQRDTSLEFKRFDNYWDPGKPYLDGIKWTQVKDPLTQIAAFTAGEVDVLSSTDAKTLSDASKIEGATLSFEYDGVVIIYPDSANTDSPLSNTLVRQAMDYAINKEDIIAVSGYGIFGAAHQVPIPGTPGYIESQDTARPFNPDKARELLKEAGYGNGFTITLAIENASRKDTQVAVQKYLADVGITCNLETWNNAIYDERQVKGWNKTGILAPGAGRFFATSMESYFLTPNYYVSLQVPPGLEEAVHEALATVELEKEKVEKISRIIFDNASMIPIHYMGAGRVFYKEQLHNAGFLDYTSFTEWSPAEAWLSR